MEHRRRGTTSKFRGEERILLFRSDRAGAIAKIIYSSEASDEEVVTKPLTEARSLREESLAPHYLTAHAKIHVLDVKSQFRGRDLGGLLFSEAMTSLRSLYCTDDDQTDDASMASECKKKTIYYVSQRDEITCYFRGEAGIAKAVPERTDNGRKRDLSKAGWGTVVKYLHKKRGA